MKHFDGINDDWLEECLNLLEEERREVEMQTVDNKIRVEWYFNRKVKLQLFKIEDLVLKIAREMIQEE